MGRLVQALFLADKEPPLSLFTAAGPGRLQAAATVRCAAATSSMIAPLQPAKQHRHHKRRAQRIAGHRLAAVAGGCSSSSWIIRLDGTCVMQCRLRRASLRLVHFLHGLGGANSARGSCETSLIRQGREAHDGWHGPGGRAISPATATVMACSCWAGKGIQGSFPGQLYTAHVTIYHKKLKRS